MDLIALISAIPGIGPALPYLSLFVAICAAIATKLPAPAGSTSYGVFYQVVNFIGMNFGEAKNANSAK